MRFESLQNERNQLFDIASRWTTGLNDCSRVALIEHHLSAVADMHQHTVSYRRDAMIRRLSDLLGPTQREHITNHCEQVADMSVRLARSMNIGPSQVLDIRMAGLLHDIGKCLIPEDMLAQNGPLDESQWSIMAWHTQIGAVISERIGANEYVTECVRHHHTWFDDQTFMDVPIGARVVCAADALVTMMSHRSYKIGCSLDQALTELRNNGGGQFDPRVVKAAPAATATWRQAA